MNVILNLYGSRRGFVFFIEKNGTKEFRDYDGGTGIYNKLLMLFKIKGKIVFKYVLYKLSQNMPPF